MDQTPGRFAYRCLPLTNANSHGWEMLCPADFTVTWNGGDGVDDVTVTSDPPLSADSPDAYLAFLTGAGSGNSSKSARETGLAPANFIESHFGSGIVTFNPMVILRTAPGYSLWVTGPVNQFKDGIQPMSAVIESDWMPFTFSMNWKITRPGTTITFRKGEPFCSFFPVQRGVIESCEPSVKSISDDPQLEKTYWSARTARNLSAALGAEDKNRFLNWYARGEDPGAPGKVRKDPPRAARPKEFK